ncbi:GNAT family N-acetyltransferase [Bacillus horti]|uniref:Ribosomal protein S18 acetylase RimI-like enzyme n=1 Tax=Caldalkalibacillus horti TaxID=77523 RepID=A0ABT9W0H5_9BACI|nr:GNAT family N-acetyltransferase [Bacillus horti]MDQ0166739.1 ribosomal protein S18 acetylase RimI-like enzyme [Bacillus horti]
MLENNSKCDQQTFIKNLEELSNLAWPSLQTKLYDGWFLRFSKGYTKRANSIHPLSPSTLELQEKIAACEELYQEKGMDVVYKMTATAFPKQLDHELEVRGYTAEGHTSVQTLDFSRFEGQLEKETIGENNIIILDTISEDWLNDYCTLNTVSEKNKEIMRCMLGQISSSTFYVTLVHEQQTVACGLGVLEGDYIGLFDIVTASKFRKQGFGKRLVSALLQAGEQHGAKHAYLQVVKENEPAVHLYASFGFKEAYQYWYRIKPST